MTDRSRELTPTERDCLIAIEPGQEVFARNKLDAVCKGLVSLGYLRCPQPRAFLDEKSRRLEVRQGYRITPKGRVAANRIRKENRANEAEKSLDHAGTKVEDSSQDEVEKPVNSVVG